MKTENARSAIINRATEREADNGAIRHVRARLPLALKIGFTLFMAILVPVYWYSYGPTNFLYFCDAAMFLTLGAVWLESSLLASMAAVGILLPQMGWVVDFMAGLAGVHLTGMTNYMFDPKHELFTRVLSLFHGWLPFLLLFLVKRLGYDRRALAGWTVLAWGLMLVCYFWMPGPTLASATMREPVNINYVYGLSDTAPQHWMPPLAYLGLMLAALPVLFYGPTHWVLKKLF